MDRINGANTVNITSALNTQVRGFRKKNKAAGLSGTEFTEIFANNIQEELLTVIEAAGLTPTDADRTQLLQALRKTAGSYSSSTFSTAAATVALTAAMGGAQILLNANSSITQAVTLPATANLPVGFPYHIMRSTIGGATISSNGGAANIESGNGFVSAITLEGGESVDLTWTGAIWIASGAYAARNVAFNAQRNLSAFGYQRLPGGLILQWGYATDTPTIYVNGKYETSGIDFLWPIAFPNQLIHAVVSAYDAYPGTGEGAWIANRTRTGARWYVRADSMNSVTGAYLAWGT